MATQDLQAIIAECVAAYDKAALAQFERDGSKDVGSCGGYMLGYRGNTKFAKALIEAGLGYRSGGTVYVSKRHTHPTQHMEVDVQGSRAFRDVAASHGFQATEARSYVD